MKFKDLKSFHSSGIVYFWNFNGVNGETAYILYHELSHAYLFQKNKNLFPSKLESERDYIYDSFNEGLAHYMAEAVIKKKGVKSLYAIRFKALKDEFIRNKCGLDKLKGNYELRSALGERMIKEVCGGKGYFINNVRILDKLIENPPQTLQELVYPREGYGQRIFNSLSKEERNAIYEFFEKE